MARNTSEILKDRSNAVASIRRIATRQLLPIGLSVALLLVLWDKASALNFAIIWRGIGQVTALEWCMAAGLSYASFWAVGRYDAVVHRLLDTGIGSRQATHAGITAITIAQSVGFGVISGALVRWRMLSELTLLQSIRLSAIVALSFLAGWAVVTALVVLVSPIPLPFPATPIVAWAIIGTALVLAVLSVLRPGLIASFKLPSLRAMGAILLLAMVDTLMAGGALYALLPTSLHIDLSTFLAAFLVALGAGLIMGTPGGVGPFEVMLITLLPHLEVESLLSAILAFRIVYYAIPAIIGAVFVIRGPRTQPDIQNKASAPLTGLNTATLGKIIETAPEAEAALLRHRRLYILSPTQPSGMVCQSNQSLVMLRGPLVRHHNPINILKNLQHAAQTNFLTPCLYKAPARLATSARRAGWKVLPVAKEALINPQTYTITGRSFRQLRRKLRKAEGLGITLTDNCAGQPLPLEKMTEIADKWRNLRGGERGFSMGVYNPETVKHARVFLAWKNGALLGFLTLHTNPGEQVLDLMRYGENAPDGLMHLLLDHAIKAAKIDGLTKVSLASVPIGKLAHENPVFSYLRQHLDQISGANGLRQFKASFAPKWQTLYFAAPTPIGLALSAIDISREITRKCP